MNTLINIFKVTEIRSRILFTLALLTIYRFGIFIAIPGVNTIAVANSRPPGQGFLDLINIFSGGALFKLSVFSLGIMPYISASIIINLMTVVIPPLARLQREGQAGRKKVNQYTRIGTIFLCAIQSYFILANATNSTSRFGEPLVSPSFDPFWFMMIGIISITTGSLLLMWLGEQITEYGIGNGISLIIFTGIVAQLPQRLWYMMKDDTIDMFPIIILTILFFILIALTVLLTTGVRKIPVQYGKKMQGRMMVQAQSQSLPFKLNSSGVMPIIFASSLLLFPQTILGFLGQDASAWTGWRVLQEWLNPFAPSVIQQIPYFIFYTILIIFFSYFYTAIQINPKELAENLKRYGGFVPGIRPGLHTQQHLEYVLNRITLPGAIFLAGLALSPYFIINFLDLSTNTNVQSLTYTFGGSSLLIMVGVALDTLKQVESQLIMRNYSGFMRKSRIRGR